MEKHLHIICFTIPHPVDHGGIFDLYYKLPALQSQGIKIHLHCFEYDRSPQPHLHQYCHTVHYYKRRQGLKAISFSLPYIVNSRKNEALLQCLLKDDYPVLMEGIHCTYLLNDQRFAGRRCFVRLHNVEFRYYHDLYRNTSSLWKKCYYGYESFLLRRYEKKVAGKAFCWSVSQEDAVLYQRLFGSKRVAYLPVYLPDWGVSGMEGKGDYCLYHGDLSISANEKAVDFLLREVFQWLDIPLVIAGRNPSERLKKSIVRYKNCSLVINPSEKKMHQLIAGAQLHVLPACTNTGIKLKLIHAVFSGRFCVVNDAGVMGSGLQSLCSIAGSASSFISVISALYQKSFTREDIQQRKALLSVLFCNTTNAQKQVMTIWGEEDL